MSVGAVVNAKDDIDLLEANIRYHRTVGVDFFVVCDRGSSEPNQARLEMLARSPNVRVLRQHLYEAENVTRETMRDARLAGLKAMQETFAPDWVLAGDTDEFWVSASGDVGRSADAAGFEHLTVDRFNAAASVEEGPVLVGRLTHSAGLLDQHVIVERRDLTPGPDGVPDGSFVFHRVQPKFMTSVREIDEVLPGFHDIRSTRHVDRGTATGLAILHLPFTSYERFATKVEDARNHFEQLGHVLGKGHGWHWRHWVSIEGDRALRGEFERQFIEPPLLRELVQQGVVATLGDLLVSREQARLDTSAEA